MTGLILKDMINLKKNLKIFAVLTAFYAFLAYSSSDVSFFSSIFTLLFAVLTLSLYSYDEAVKWDTYALTMPIYKENIVQSKYIMMLLLTIVGALLGTAISAFIDIILREGDNFPTIIRSCSLGAAVVVLFYSITLPFITKLGVEKARLVFFAVYIIPFAIYFFIHKGIENGSMKLSDSLKDVISIFIKNVVFILPLVVLAALIISYNISVRIFQKKEF